MFDYLFCITKKQNLTLTIPSNSNSTLVEGEQQTTYHLAELVQERLEPNLAIHRFMRTRIVLLQGFVQIPLRCCNATSHRWVVTVHNQAPVKCHRKLCAALAPLNEEFCTVCVLGIATLRCPRCSLTFPSGTRSKNKATNGRDQNSRYCCCAKYWTAWFILWCEEQFKYY